MENKEQQILSEIKSMMASIRSQLERLDAKMAELQQVVDPEDLDASPIDIDIDLDDVQVVEVQEIPMEVEEEPVEAPVEAPVEEEPKVEETEVEEEPIVEEEPEVEAEAEPEVEPEVEEEPEPVVEEEPEAEPEVEEVPVEEEPVENESEIDDDLPFAETPVEETPVEEVPVEAPVEEDDDDLPGVFDLPAAPVTVAAKAADQARPILNEVMAADCAWRKDMPGSPVRDIRSAISLNDRVIFINLLFKEDAQTFVDTLSKINTMETLDQVVEYICAEFPSWDLNSDLVYRFMMAVRRKVK